jgi:dihydrofolate reductase
VYFGGMRKIVVLTFLALDGVMQAPGGSDEDTAEGFKYGGWGFPYFDDALGEVMAKQMGQPYDLLLGHKTYDIFASYWPKQDEKTSTIAKPFNDATKYVASEGKVDLSWKNSKQVKSIDEIKKLKEGDGPTLQVHGSAKLVQSLLKADIVDELWLKIHPVTLGKGKKLFAEGAIPASWELTESSVTPKGVIIANYKRAGDVETGDFG